MLKNLVVVNFANGDEIFQANIREDWNKGYSKKTPAQVYLDLKEVNGEKYGKLYNWYAVNDPRGVTAQG